MEDPPAGGKASSHSTGRGPRKAGAPPVKRKVSTTDSLPGGSGSAPTAETAGGAALGGAGGRLPSRGQREGVHLRMPPEWGKTLQACAWVVLMGLIGYALLLRPAGVGAAAEAALLLSLGWQNAVLFSAMVLAALYPPALLALVFPAFVASPDEAYLPLYLAASVFLGPFAVLPYFLHRLIPLACEEAAQQQRPEHLRAPEGPAQPVQGRATVYLQYLKERLPQLLSSPYLAHALLAAAALLTCLAAVANRATWADFWRLRESSLVVHTLLGELLVLAALSAVLAAWDAAARNDAYYGAVVKAALVGILPGVGPGLYLVMTRGPVEGFAAQESAHLLE